MIHSRHSDHDSANDAQVERSAEVPMTSYARRLTLFDGTMVVVGGIVGAGIFLNPAIVAQRAVTPGLILAVWAIGGAIAFVGAVCYAELGARRPQAGGGYVYLREAFGPLFGFLYGWMLLLVSNTGAIAALAVTFARYSVALVDFNTAWIQPLAVAAILLLSCVNYLGVRPGSVTQNIFTLLKLLALAVLIGAGLALGGGFDFAGPDVVPAPSGYGVIGLIGIALIPVLFSYGGWQHANHIAGELIRPHRNLPRALLIGVGLVVAVYLLANWAYLGTLGPERLAASLAPASDAMQSVLGDAGSTLIGAGIVASTFGILNLYILAAPRVFQAMADDGLFFKRFARLHPRFKTPSGAIILQAAWGIALTLTGTYSQLLDYVVFGDWIFFALVVATLFFYRRRSEGSDGTEEGFRMVGYPWLPALFIAAAGFVVFSSVGSNPLNALVGLLLIGAGVPVYWYWKRKSR